MSGEMRTAGDVFAWTESFTNLERGALFDKRHYHLERMRKLLGLFDDPDSGLRIVHVAGTKGKGSTAAMLASVLHAAGNRTAMYASPHVTDPFERIVVMGEPPQPELLVRLGREVRKAIESLPADEIAGSPSPTTFELYTLLAFLYFREAGCAEAVVEVGIGGRLDATNVVMPESTVITPLDLEHMDVLGDTIEKIAEEKGGIMKPGIPAYIGFQPPSVKKVFENLARDRGAPVAFLDEEISSLETSLDNRGTSFRLSIRGEKPADFRLSLLGEFQAENAALAYLVLRKTRPEIAHAQFSAGFQTVTLPGRMEVVGEKPPLILDGAHTPLAVTKLLASFQKVFPGPAILLFGSVAGKRPREMARILAPGFKKIIVSTPGTYKESDPAEVFEIFHFLNPATVLERDPSRALHRAREESGGSLPILVTGSFYMVAEIRRMLS